MQVTQVKLAYPMESLEPNIDAKTMNFHYGTHYKAYVDNLNKATAAAGSSVMSSDLTSEHGLPESVDDTFFKLAAAFHLDVSKWIRASFDNLHMCGCFSSKTGLGVSGSKLTTRKPGLLCLLTHHTSNNLERPNSQSRCLCLGYVLDRSGEEGQRLPGRSVHSSAQPR